MAAGASLALHGPLLTNWVVPGPAGEPEAMAGRPRSNSMQGAKCCATSKAACRLLVPLSPGSACTTSRQLMSHTSEAETMASSSRTPGAKSCATLKAAYRVLLPLSPSSACSQDALVSSQARP